MHRRSKYVYGQPAGSKNITNIWRQLQLGNAKGRRGTRRNGAKLSTHPFYIHINVQNLKYTLGDGGGEEVEAVCTQSLTRDGARYRHTITVATNGNNTHLTCAN